MSTIRPTWLVRRTKVVAVCRAAFHQHTRTDIRGCNDNVVAQIKSFACRHHGCTQDSAVARQLLAAEEVVGTWASVDLAAAIRKLASVALKARRQNELSLIRTRMIRPGKAPQRFISHTVKPYRAPREHYAFIADLYSSLIFSLTIRHSWPGFIHLRIPEHFATARKFVPAPFAALPSSHLDGLQNIPVSVLS